MIPVIYNARLQGRDGLWEIQLAQGQISAVIPAQDQKNYPAGALDAQGGLLLPPFIEPHIHLDTTQTAGMPRWDESGTLFEGIACWIEQKKNLTYQDVKERARKTLLWQIAQGIQYVRTHVDICDPQLTTLRAVLELKEEMAPWVTIQIVAFPQEGILSFPRGTELLEEALCLGADAVGAIPHFEFTREYGVQSLHIIFDLAQKYQCLVDVHCDEIDDEQSRFLETLAMLAYETGMKERVTASHTTAMHSYNGAYASRLFRLLQLSEINFVANPLVNIHLQGRFDTYPKRRGLTRVKELLDAGINVCLGHDDVYDAWYPLGTGNMLQVLHMGLHVCQMMDYSQINDSLHLITTHSARTLNLQNYGIAVDKPANLIVLPVANGFKAVRCQPPVRYSIREGKLLAECSPSMPVVHVPAVQQIDFRSF